eukprot:403355238
MDSSQTQFQNNSNSLVNLTIPTSQSLAKRANSSSSSQALQKQSSNNNNNNNNNNLQPLIKLDYEVNLPQDEEIKKQRRPRNDIKDIRSYKQLDKVELDLESPRLKQACHQLGISLTELSKKKRDDFVQKGLDEDLINLRFKHFQQRLIDTINNVLQERRQIKIKQMQKALVEQKLNDPSQSLLISQRGFDLNNYQRVQSGMLSHRNITSGGGGKTQNDTFLSATMNKTLQNSSSTSNSFFKNNLSRGTQHKPAQSTQLNMTAMSLSTTTHTGGNSSSGFGKFMNNLNQSLNLSQINTQSAVLSQSAQTQRVGQNKQLDALNIKAQDSSAINNDKHLKIPTTSKPNKTNQILNTSNSIQQSKISPRTTTSQINLKQLISQTDIKSTLIDHIKSINPLAGIYRQNQQNVLNNKSAIVLPNALSLNQQRTSNSRQSQIAGKPNHNNNNSQSQMFNQTISSNPHANLFSQRKASQQLSQSYRAHPLVQDLVQQELEKLEKQKQQKLKIIQQQIERDEKYQKQLKDKEKKLQKISKKLKDNLNEKSEERLQKRQTRTSEFNKRILNLSKEFEDQVSQEIFKQNESMQMSADKRELIEHEKREQLKQKEQEYREKVSQILYSKKQQEQQEIEECQRKLESIQNKLSRSQQLHESHIRRVKSEAKMRNDHANNIFSLHRQSIQDLAEQNKLNYQEQENKKRRKLREQYQDYKWMLDQQKQQNTQKMEDNLKRKQEDMLNQTLQLQSMEFRQQEVSIIKDQVRREQEKEFMLQNEYRRLKSEDIRKLRERQKRLDQSKKFQILQRDHDHQELMKHLQDGEKQLQKSRMQEFHNDFQYLQTKK